MKTENLTKEHEYKCVSCGTGISRGAYHTFFGLCENCNREKLSGSVAAPKEEPKERCQYELWVNEYFGLPEKFPERARTMDFDYGQIVNLLAMFDEKRNDWHKDNLENVMHERDLELSSLRDQLRQRDELIKELTEAIQFVVDAHNVKITTTLKDLLESLIKKSQKL